MLAVNPALSMYIHVCVVSKATTKWPMLAKWPQLGILHAISTFCIMLVLFLHNISGGQQLERLTIVSSSCIMLKLLSLACPWKLSSCIKWRKWLDIQ